MRVYKNGNFEVVKGTLSSDKSCVRFYVKEIDRKGFLAVFKSESAAMRCCDMYAKNVSSVQYI